MPDLIAVPRKTLAFLLEDCRYALNEYSGDIECTYCGMEEDLECYDFCQWTVINNLLADNPAE